MIPRSHPSGRTIRITVERHPSAVPQNLPAVPDTGADRRKAAQERRRQAVQVTFASAETKADGTSFTTNIPIPAGAPAKPWTVRVSTGGDVPAAGTRTLP